MSRFTAIFSSLAFCASGLTSISPAHAGTVHRFFEDFATEQYKDAANTTAWWNTGASRLELYPFDPRLVGGNDTPGYSRDLVVAGDYVFAVDGDSGLQVFDISDPANPVHIGNYDTSGFSSDVFVSGDYAFVADGLSGLQVVDIIDPSKPSPVSNYDTPGYSRGVTVEGDHAYVADGEVRGDASLLVIDISDPAKPSLAGTLAVTGLPIGTFVWGDYAYFASGPGGLQVIDISDPTRPALVTTFPTPAYARNVVVAGDRAFLATAESGLYIIDIHDPTAPTLLGDYDTPDYAFGVAAFGNHVCVADDETGLQMFDAADPTTPLLMSTTDTPGKSISTAVAGSHTYVADGPSSLQVIRSAEPIAPLLLGSYATSDDALCVKKAGRHAYVVTPGGLLVLEMSDPSSPVLTGSLSTQVGGTSDIEIAGRYAYVPSGPVSGLLAFDISDPANPSLPSSIVTGDAAGVAIAGDYAYVADGSSGFKVIDISDPLVMTEAGAVSMPGFAIEVALSGDHAFVASDGYGLVVVDIRDPSLPQQIGGHADGVGANDIVVAGDHAFVTTSTGLREFDISDPANPSPVGSFDTPGAAVSVTVAGDVAVVGDGPDGMTSGAVHAIDIRDPSKPVLIGTLPAQNALGVHMSGAFACVADGPSGVKIVEVFHRLFDRSRAVAQSTNVHGRSDDILRVRLSTTQTKTVDWEVSADGTSWNGVESGGPWLGLDSPGNELRWKSTHRYTEGLVNPVCEQLELEWLYDFATIDSITDVPDDDGGWVDLYFWRSGHDFSDDATPVNRYLVYRRSDDVTVPQVTRLPASVLPPGNWEVVDTVAAGEVDRYAVTVPTLGDSAATLFYTVYAVVAETGTLSFCSLPDSGYSVGNSVVIARFDASVDDERVTLSWDVQGSVSGFNIYRSPKPTGFEKINPSLLPAAGREYVDGGVESGNTYWYRLGVVDPDGGETLSATASVNIRIATFALYQNQPNPFNPVTTISYEIPDDGQVSLQIFDVGGALVRTLVATHQQAGPWAVSWDGTDDRSQKIASGVYFYRLRASGLEQTRKMTFVE
jgi:hypothetical protein